MNPSDLSALRQVAQSSTRYSTATTELSKSIEDLEAFLNELPGKREVLVSSKTQPGLDSLRFGRGRDGRWAIFIVPGLANALVAVFDKPQQKGENLLRNAPVDTKLACAPLLGDLLAALSSSFIDSAVQAESAVAAIRAALNSHGKGGA